MEGKVLDFREAIRLLASGDVSEKRRKCPGVGGKGIKTTEIESVSERRSGGGGKGKRGAQPMARGWGEG